MLRDRSVMMSSVRGRPGAPGISKLSEAATSMADTSSSRCTLPRLQGLAPRLEELHPLHILFDLDLPRLLGRDFPALSRISQRRSVVSLVISLYVPW